MNKKVMTVEDSSSIRQLIVSNLDEAGYNVLEAPDGQAAYDILKDTMVDMVITDLNMPNLDGIGLIKALRALSDYRFIPIILLTTESQKSKVKEGKDAGVTGWIVKPFDPQYLISVVKKMIG
jgi:two-component system, chemotaxis family, chemotaxis protein CheY